MLRHPEPHKSVVEKVDTVIRNVDVAGSNPSARPTAEAGADKLAMGVGVGDHVTITVNEQQLETLQKDFGGCTTGMIKVKFMKKKVSSAIWPTGSSWFCLITDSTFLPVR